MIRRGKTEGWLSAPTERTEEWAKFNGAVFNGVRVGRMKGLEDHGSTIISTQEFGPNAEEPLMIVPRDLVLSLELVESYAKSDEVVRKLLAALGEFGRVSFPALSLSRSSLMVVLFTVVSARCHLDLSSVTGFNVMSYDRRQDGLGQSLHRVNTTCVVHVCY